MIDASDAAVTFTDVTVVLERNIILDRVAAAVPRGGCTVILGPNGAGKTTLLLTLLRQIPFHGDIGFPGRKAPPRIGYVPQRLNLEPGLPLTTRELVGLTRGAYPLWLGLSGKERSRADRLLDMVNLSECRDRRIVDLSGGELQRLLLALALGREPELLLLDEPISAVDAGSREELIHLLARLRREFGFTQLMVSHDLLPSIAAADHLICLNRRTVAEGSPSGLAASGALYSLFPGLRPDLFAAAGVEESGHA